MESIVRFHKHNGSGIGKRRFLAPVLNLLVFVFLLTGQLTSFGDSPNSTNDGRLQVPRVEAFSLVPLSSSPSSRSPLSLRARPTEHILLDDHHSSLNTTVHFSDLIKIVSEAEYMDTETKKRFLESLNGISPDASREAGDTHVINVQESSHVAVPATANGAEQCGDEIQAKTATNTTGLKTGRHGIPTIEGLWEDDGGIFRASGAWQTTPLLMKGAFVDDIHGLARDNDYPFPSWNEMIELACDGTLEHNDGDVHGKRLYEGDFGDDVNDEVDYGDDCDDDDDDEYEHQYDAWVGDGDAVEAFESGNEGFYAWGDESQYDDDEDKSDNPPSRLIQYSWPRHVDSDYHSDVNTNWLDTFEIKQFGPFNDPDSLEALLRTEDEDNSERYAARTLLVNDVDRWFPKLSDWMDRRFNNNKSKGGVLPARWRRDDAQISLSYAKGGIGPHVDDYDVFLIQLAGERTWDVLWEESSHDGEELWFNTKGHGMSKISVRDETACILPESSTNGVRILNVTKLQALQKHLFTSSRTRLTRLHLRPGDCLYLPPRVLHCGTAVAASEDSMTLSVGCRAPSAVELLDGLSALMKKSATTPSPQTMASTGSTLPSDAAIQAFHRRYTNAEFGRNNSNHKDNAYISGEDVAVSKVLSSASQSSWLSPQVKNEMKNLVLKAVQTALDDDENVLDPLIGRFVTKSNRLEEMDFGPGDDSLLTSFSYPKALGSIIDDDLHGRDEGNGNDVWGNATTALQEVFGMTESKEGSEDSFLRRAEGVSFAWSCVCDLERRIRKYRLYAQGRPPFEVLEVTHEGTEEYHDSSDSFVSAPNSKVGRLMDQIANGPPLDRTFVVDELQILIDVKQKGTQHTITRLLYDLVEEGLLYGGYHSPYNS